MPRLTMMTTTDEPNTLETLEWPENVLVFHDPSDGKYGNLTIDEIKSRIKPTEDPSKNEVNGKPDYTSDNHFSTRHYALLFAPGVYKDCDFEVGYYVQVAGLGASARDVLFTGRKSGPFVNALNKYLSPEDYSTIAYNGSGLCLDTFWRAAENFAVDCNEPLRWAVSQAAPLRRVHAMNNTSVVFGDGGAYASGGVLANARIDGPEKDDDHDNGDDGAGLGVVDYTSQQQWYTRNTHFGGCGGAKGGAWNLTFSGCTGNVPAAGMDPSNPNRVVTVEEEPTVRVEKPFVVLNGNKWELHVPQATKELCSGPALEDSSDTDRRDFARVKVCAMRADDKDADDKEAYNMLDETDERITNELQAALDEGKDLVLCPGTFYLTKTLTVKFPNQVVVGLGLATFIAPQDGSPCIRVLARTPGVRIAGITLEASMQKTSCTGNADGVRSLLEFGEPDFPSDDGDGANPSALSDVFARVGGVNLERELVYTDVMIRIHSGNVVGDNLWLWRADHCKLDSRNGEKPNDPNLPLYHQVRRGECGAKTGLEVRGDHVKMYGLFCEHTTQDQLIWSGSDGEVSFFQCELPYDVYHEDFKDYVGYKLDDKVKTHGARGVGVYCNFQVDAVKAISGIRHDADDGREPLKAAGVRFDNPFTVFLDGHKESGIDYVLNEQGQPVDYARKGTPSWIYNPDRDRHQHQQRRGFHGHVAAAAVNRPLSGVFGNSFRQISSLVRRFIK